MLIGADGKRNTLRGFKRKEFRGKLAIAITANFINKHTENDARVEVCVPCSKKTLDLTIILLNYLILVLIVLLFKTILN